MEDDQSMQPHLSEILPVAQTPIGSDSISKLIEFGGPCLSYFRLCSCCWQPRRWASCASCARVFELMWLAAFAAAFVAWVGVLLWQLQPAAAPALNGAELAAAFSFAPAFSTNPLSWGLAFAVVSLEVAGLLIAPARRDSIDSRGWALSLAFSGLALLAIAADNLPTIVLAWAALDLGEVILTLRPAEDRITLNAAAAPFVVRMISLACVLLAFVLGSGSGNGDNYVFLLLAGVALRLVALIFEMRHSRSAYLQEGIGVTLPLASAAATLSLLSRLQLGESGSGLLGLLLLFGTGAALYSGWQWMLAGDDIIGRPYWVLGLSALALGSAIQGNPAGATGWTIALVLAGGALFLSATRTTRLKQAVLIGAWCISALPFSISAAAWSEQPSATIWALPPLVLAQALLLAGYVRHARTTSTRLGPSSQSAWTPAIFDAGLAFVLAIQLLLGFWGWDGARQLGLWPAGLIAAAVGLGLYWRRMRVAALAAGPSGRFERVARLAANLAGATLRGAHAALGQLLVGITDLLEGDAGIMWGLLVLALLVSVIVNRTP